jgi:hypothetical protein
MLCFALNRPLDAFLLIIPSGLISFGVSGKAIVNFSKFKTNTFRPSGLIHLIPPATAGDMVLVYSMLAKLISDLHNLLDH